MDVDGALPEAGEHVQPGDSLDEAQVAGRGAGSDWEATPLPSQPANPAAQAVRDYRDSAVRAPQPDINYVGSMEEMPRLRAATAVSQTGLAAGRCQSHGKPKDHHHEPCDPRSSSPSPPKPASEVIIYIGVCCFYASVCLDPGANNGVVGYMCDSIAVYSIENQKKRGEGQKLFGGAIYMPYVI